MTGFIDAHVHFWNPSRLRYDWLKQEPALNRPFELPDFQRATAALPVTGFVFVQAECDANQSLEEIEWVIEQCKNEPKLLGIVAQASVEKGKAVGSDLDALIGRPGVRGVRRLIELEADPTFCTQPSFIAGVREVGRRDLSFDLCVTSNQLPGVIELVSQCPDVRFCLDHVGKPEIKKRSADAWFHNLKILAALPNVACKISGLLTEASSQWTVDDLRPYVEFAIEQFGWTRVLFGSDWPVVTLAGTCKSWFDAVQKVVSPCSADEQFALFANNARLFYRLH